MPSQRNNLVRRSLRSSDNAASRDLPPAILDATRSSVLAVGVRRTTLTDVARRAGVSRMTVYRLVPDVETLVFEVLTRDFAALLAEAERSVARRRSARARLVGLVLEIAKRLPEQPLFLRIMDVDPELLLPFMTDRLGTTQRTAMAHLRRLIAEGHGDGSVRRGDLDAQAAAILFTTTSFVLSARLLPEAGGTDAVLRELAAIVDRGLAT